MSAGVTLHAVAVNLYFDTVTLYSSDIPSRGPMHKISQLGIPKWRPICKPNPEMGSRHYKFLYPRSRDWEFNPKIAITIFFPTAVDKKLLIMCSAYTSFCLTIHSFNHVSVTYWAAQDTIHQQTKCNFSATSCSILNLLRLLNPDIFSIIQQYVIEESDRIKQL